MTYLLIPLALLAFGLTKVLLKPLGQLLIDGGALRKNYQGQEVPVAMGLILGFSILIPLLIYQLAYSETGLIALVLMVTMLIGFIDDMLGNHSAKGLKGHFSLLLREQRLSSGALKAIVISLISLYLAYHFSNNLLNWLINFFILILVTNSFNLLDVRPGRAIKAFVFLSGLLIIAAPLSSFFLVFLLASVLAYAPWDLKAKGMLGDTGANLLGMAVGIATILSIPIGLKMVIFLGLIYLHWYTERKSLTALIEQVGFLRLLDNLGR